MKFRNPETGEVLRYRDIIPVLCKSGCDNCPIIADVLKHDNQSCQAWILNHPHKAARLMGYEVVEEMWEPQLNEGEMDKEMEKNHFSAIKEANMDKPRICEILGVVPEEEFFIRGFYPGHVTFRIMDDGTFSTRPSNISGSTKELLQTLDHPDRIIRKPRWTEQEVELAKVLYDLRRSESIVIGRNKGGALWWRDGDSAEGILPHNLFPTLSECNCVKLDEIIGGAE
jgi:hypothetical protein